MEKVEVDDMTPRDRIVSGLDPPPNTVPHTRVYTREMHERWLEIPKQPKQETRMSNTKSKPKELLYDVVAVHIKKNTVRLFGTEKTLRNAEAIVEMAVMRRGVDTEFYSEVPTGMYAEGDQWRGDRIHDAD